MESLWKVCIEKLKRLDWVVLGATVLLATAGILFVKTACSSRSAAFQDLWIGQLQFAVVGFVLMLLLGLIDYRRWTKLSPWIYVGVLVALVLVLIPGLGVERMGARRWLFGLQPSEPAKLGVIFMMAWLLGRGGESLRNFSGLMLCGVLAGVPALLILMEPDLGTALVLAPTVLAMLFVARVSPKVVGIGVLVLALVVGYEMTLVKMAKADGVEPARSEQLLKWTGLRDHQIERLETFIYPMRDPRGNGYNAYQSEIAVGSGGLYGKGYGQGVQHRFGYLPSQVALNDFIFPVVAEEMGFVGAALLLGVYLFGLLVPTMIVGLRCEDDVGKLLCVGVASLIFCHIFINIGMTVRIVPITGLPLPFISQGGTFMLVMMMAVGVVQSVAIHGRVAEGVFRH